ncbi:coiled-coil domain-containing protein [Bacillus tuaregi]|uniref:coiled-coil domain-containing protein n=1 Tax=Bacillus tuaregi TaxID=1816695 RepID=UPI0008F8EEE6|nr:NlpC/P60 family protein [Bacillus tuaregi]
MKKKLVTLSTTFMLGMGSLIAVPAVKADTIDSIKTEISQAQKDLTSIQAQKADLEAQIARMEQAIKDNSVKMEEANIQMAETQVEIDRLNSEITVIEERIASRTEILKERAVSFQENGGDVNYLEVILGSKSFGDFIDRIGAVVTIVEADQGIIQDHENDKKELEVMQSSVEQKMTDLTNLKTELEGMQSQTEEQKAQTEELKAKLASEETDKLADIANYQEQIAELQAAAAAAPTSSNNTKNSTTNTGATVPTGNSSSVVGSGSISTVINAGYKYIGNSVYVFGGGRNASDIANGRFDCSGFVSWAFSQAGVKVGASTEVLKNTGTRVPASEMRPGDMVFFNTYKTDGHVGIYIGGGKFIGSQSSTGVAIANMSSGYWAQTFNGRVMRVIN